MFLANYSDGLTDLPLPEQLDALPTSTDDDRQLPVRQAEPELPRRLARARTAGHGASRTISEPSTSGSTAASSSSAARSSTTCSDGEELVLEPFQRLIAATSSSLAYQYDGFWTSHGHLQGQAAPRGPVRARASAPWEVWKAGGRRRAGEPPRRRAAAPRARLTLASTLGAAGRSADPVPRRALRRHRDRLRRHDPHACSRAYPTLECPLGRLQRRRRARGRRRAAAPTRSWRAAARHGVSRRDVPRRLLPLRRAPRSRTYFETLKRASRPTSSSPTTATIATRTIALVSDLTWNTFRDHLILEYEIPKYDGDLGRAELLRAARRRHGPGARPASSRPCSGPSATSPGSPTRPFAR